MIWSRLNKWYGSAKIVKKALFQKLESFPRISNKDYSKLRDLSDLLMELNAAKAEGDLPGLFYLNTARGVNPIVQKLPYGLQEKSNPMDPTINNNIKLHYSHFSVFVAFLHQQAQIRVACSNQDRTKKKLDDPDKTCPVHNKPHFLQKCSAFHAKSIEESKNFLKNGICFKCCISTAHTARECQCTLRCTECDSGLHPCVLHPGPPPWVKDTHPSSEHGGVYTNARAIECSKIPDIRVEIPTPNAAYFYSHLKPIAHLIPELNPCEGSPVTKNQDSLRAPPQSAGRLITKGCLAASSILKQPPRRNLEMLSLTQSHASTCDLTPSQETAPVPNVILG
ncbi:hypothetical protein SRHO_G00307680 [Serrasalmus rhombeus]